jgi:lactate dehydrogenase-like 2-hydroxyacid dehydrogenase
MPEPLEILLVGPYPDWDMADLEKTYKVRRLWEAEDQEALLTSCANRIRAIATRGELGANAALMARLPRLEIVSCYGVGTDAIDLVYARENGIAVTNTPDVLTEDVADHGFALLLAAARQIPQADRYVRSGAWAKGNMHLTTRVCGKKIGIAGMGRVGQALARRAAGFDCEISYFDRVEKSGSTYRFFADLPALAAYADFLVVTLAGGEATRNIIDRTVLDALGRDGIFVNISRGSTVDEPALLDALEAGTIKAAALDVFWGEPNIDPRFLALDNVVLQPHHASGTIETRKAMGQLVRDNLAAHFGGKPLLTPVRQENTP